MHNNHTTQQLHSWHLSQRNENLCQKKKTKPYAQIFIALLFIIAKNCKQLRCLSTGIRLNKSIPWTTTRSKKG